MITHLRIRNLALIEDAALDLAAGLNALTGETGAGKSLVLEGLAMVLGGRAQPALVREGCERAEVEAVADLSAQSAVRHWLEERGLLSTEPAELILRREVFAKGRSRAWINGRLAPAGQLAELGALLAETHGQHQSVALLRAARQREAFDAAMKLAPLASEVEQHFAEARRLEEALAQLEEREREDRQQLDFLRFQIAEIDELAPQPGEDDALRAERERLAHVEALRASGAQCVSALCEAEDDRPTATDLLGEAAQALRQMARFDEELGERCARLEALAQEANDLALDCSRYVEQLEADPARLEEIDERLEAIRRLERKHGAGIEAIAAAHARMIEEAHALENREFDRERLTTELKAARKLLAERAAALTKARRNGSNRFASNMKRLLRRLALPAAEFEVRLRPHERGVALADGTVVGPAGAETVEFVFSANEGEAPRALGEVASGGELSRVMLSLHTLCADDDGAALLVFDEIDAGLSGEAALHVAAALEELARRRQVLCVTHQPTIASRAAHHLLLSKRSLRGRTTSSARDVRGDERRREIARLLDGAASEKSLDLAGEMLACTA